MSRILTVVGGLGNQGSGLVRAALADKAAGNSFFDEVRVVTRDGSKPAAIKMRQLGAEIVVADLNDLESVKRAFDGSSHGFGVTNFWPHLFASEQATAHDAACAEIREGTNLAFAVQAAGLEHFVWSGLQSTIGDRVQRVPHFWTKYVIGQMMVELGLNMTEVQASFFFNNPYLFGLGKPTKAEGQSHYDVTLPLDQGAVLPGIWAEDIGRAVYGIFKAEDKDGGLIGETIGLAAEHVTGEQIAQAYAERFGVDCRFNSVTPEDFAKFGFKGAQEIAEMFGWQADEGDDFLAYRNPEEIKRFHPEARTFRQGLDDFGPETFGIEAA